MAETAGESHRRRAAHLYGLVITGSVLAAAPTDLGLVRVAALLAGTLLVYWVAETYAHWVAARTVVRRALTSHEAREVMTDGLPLVTACAIPAAVLLVEAVLDVEPGTAIDVALAVNVVLLGVVGWRMGVRSGMRGLRLVLSTALCCLLGVAMIVLKLSLHH
ncbi:hypothetical protein KIN34_04445 [Cellulomonas sp. DKR-3]|uniref:Integral membrane protein n=1 Tax=Cellulomonas fulva TaxID=2835530 RepID=A0ABS5TWQ1_9CELL|nr:hypothetical protein [Cellulomonas fulva]MBT0993534.1 hypothetical protein [Cellulomonas fulva]